MSHLLTVSRNIVKFNRCQINRYNLKTITHDNKKYFLDYRLYYGINNNNNINYHVIQYSDNLIKESVKKCESFEIPYINTIFDKRFIELNYFDIINKYNISNINIVITNIN